MSDQSKAVVIKPTEGNRRALISRFGDKEFGAALTVEQFIALSNAYGLNPFMGHITPFQGRPYIEEQGWLHLINREVPGQLVGVESRPATKAEYDTFGVSTDDYFAVAAVTRRWGPGSEVIFTRRAIIARRLTLPTENERAAIARGSKVRHVVEDPWDMVEKQARVRALRMGFADVLRKAGGELPSIEEAEAVAAASEPGVIEGEARIVEADAPNADKADWGRLWATARDLGMLQPEVHAIFGAPKDESALAEWARGQAKSRGISLQQQVEDMADMLESKRQRTEA